MSAAERSGWRDEALSLRHREWGENAPAVDIDWPVIEYDRARAVAVIDYKESHSPRVGQPRDTSTRAFAGLATDAGRPAFAVRYRPRMHVERGDWQFCVIALNELAQNNMPDRIRLDELEYVRWIYRLRGRAVPESVTRRIVQLNLAERVLQLMHDKDMHDDRPADELVAALESLLAEVRR